MLAYLEAHSHPEMKKILPSTVVDQLKLWDSERNRLKITPGFLYQQFLRQEDYNDVVKYAKDVGCLVWSMDKKRMLVVTLEGHEQVRLFVKRKVVKPGND